MLDRKFTGLPLLFLLRLGLTCHTLVALIDEQRTGTTSMVNGVLKLVITELGIVLIWIGNVLIEEGLHGMRMIDIVDMLTNRRHRLWTILDDLSKLAHPMDTQTTAHILQEI